MPNEITGYETLKVNYDLGDEDDDDDDDDDDGDDDDDEDGDDMNKGDG